MMKRSRQAGFADESRPDVLITLPEAAEILDPPISAEQLRALVQVAGLQPRGFRRTGGAGRPARTYPAGALMRLHASIMPVIHEFTQGLV